MDKIYIKNHDPILICSSYRQWSLPACLGQSKSKDIKFQKLRFIQYLENIKKALDSKLTIIILHDVNIDISPGNNHNCMYNLGSIYQNYRDFLINYNLSIVNNKYTRYSKHQSPSTIDHIVTK